MAGSEKDGKDGLLGVFSTRASHSRGAEEPSGASAAAAQKPVAKSSQGSAQPTGAVAASSTQSSTQSSVQQQARVTIDAKTQEMSATASNYSFLLIHVSTNSLFNRLSTRRDNMLRCAH